MKNKYLPESLPIFGKDYQIKEVSPCLDDDNNEVSGTTDNGKCIIEVDSKQSNSEKLHTLVHELGHAMIFRTSIQQTQIHGEVEEILVNNWATLMTEIFHLQIRRK